MKRLLLIALIVFVSIVSLVLNGFGDERPQYGGVMKVIAASGPRTFYFPEGGPQDLGASFPGTEALMEYSDNRALEPFLAESVNIDPKNLTITFHLRKGVMFHDGTEMDADVVKWSFDFTKDMKRLQYGDKLKSVRALDKYTVRLYLTEYNNQLIHSFGWRYQVSMKAYQTKDKDWLASHVVGTGPFKMVEWKRDAYIKWEKNKDYWQKGKPYLGGIEFRFIPDSTTAAAIMQAKEADMWTGATAKDQSDLVKKGFIRQTGYAGLPIIIYANTTDPNKPTGKLKVREAIEYAINKPAMAKALGFGYYIPLKMVAPEGEWGYDPRYKGRPYNPKMAKKLLAEAGYPNGLKLKLLCMPETGGRNAAGEAIRGFLAEVGIDIDVDIADPGRFFGSMWGTGWDDLALFFTGLDPNYLVTFQRWFSHDPATNLVSFKRSPKLIALSKKSINYARERDQKAITKKLVRQMADEALVIPLYHTPAAIMLQSWVHTDYLKQGFIRWKTADMWMEKH